MSSIPVPPTSVASDPWWRFGIVWLVIGGPAAIVVAGIAMVAVAYRGADPPVPVAVSPAMPQLRATATPTAPALQARNHAATPAH